MLRSVLNSSLWMFLCVSVVDVNASNFVLESEINARVIYDDNANFSADNEESASIFMVTPKVKLIHQNDAWETAINAHVSGVTYSDQFQDQIDGHLDLETIYKDERNIYSILAGYDVVSERAVDEVIIGQTSEQTDITTLTLAPKYTRLLTERLSLSLSYSYSDVSFSPNTLGRYLPYEIQTATGVMAYKLSQKTELNLFLVATDYTSENDISEYQLLLSKLGIVHNLSELITAKFFIGANTRDFTTRSSENFTFLGSLVTGTQVVETSDSGSILEASIDAKWIELVASRNTQPNGYGGLSETDTVRAKLKMQVTPLVGLVLIMDRVDTEELNSNVEDRSRDVTRIIPSVRFSLKRNLTLSAEYFFMERDDAVITKDTLEKNKFSINLKYIFPSI